METRPTIYTFGYEKRRPEELRAESDRLDAVVMDVRIKPFSRRPDWAKSHLTALLGDRYRWVAGFGNVNYKGGPVELADPEAGLAQIADLIEQGRNIILLCYEADPKTCHRSQVAELIAERWGCDVQHLVRDSDSAQLALL
jgi:uncharacterized protein (DUF488 family)